MSEQPLMRGTRKELTGITAKVRARKEVSDSQNEWRRWAELLVRYRRRPADAVLFCKRHKPSLLAESDNQNTVTTRAQSELSQSSVRATVRAQSELGFYRQI